MINYNKIIEEIYQKYKETSHGHVATYIPELGHVDTKKFGASLFHLRSESVHIGDFDEAFSIQSISKVLSLSLAYRTIGETIWSRVGVEPSGNPFNSLIQLEHDNGIPRNPFINAGALVICDILMEKYENYEEQILSLIRELSGNNEINFDMNVVSSEKEFGYRNSALVNFIKSFDNIKNKPDDVLDYYYKICSIKMSCKDLAQTFSIFANNGVVPLSKKEILSSSQTKRINAIMLTCGFYDESGEFSFKVGLPGKSGVGGGIVAVLPNHYCIAVWSPELNSKGNSYKGMRLLEDFTTLTGESIF